MKKVVLVGAGVRARSMFASKFSTELKEHLEFCGIYDANPIRARLVSEENGNVPVFDDFETMINAVRPDLIVVATSDDTHHTYIIKGLDAGCDVISEKPLTIDRAKCEAILEAEKRSGRKVTVTFNLRFMPYLARVKQLLLDGAVGRIHHIAHEYFLDRRHGADYFRRWHGQMERSGGLLVHKATHHFDIMNWFIASKPKEVHAFGRLAFYGPNREQRGERCLTCSHQSSCEFYYDIRENEVHTRYYLQAEQEDGYIRDRCLFGEHIDIYDTMSVNVKYENDTLLTYSLMAYSPYEGWKVTINGSDGRMEIREIKSGPESGDKHHTIRIYRNDGELIEHQVPAIAEGHGGGDVRLRRMLFVGDVPDLLGQTADSAAGVMSVMIGAAANESIARGTAVHI